MKMRTRKKKENYEVGYGKPPESGRFKEGVSGNPSGRPKKTSDLNSELMRELKSDVIINENGKRKKIKKYQALVKQLTNKALSSNLAALREVFARWELAIEKAAEEQRHAKRTADELTDEELTAFIREGRG